MKISKRALRRHHTERLKKKRLYHFGRKLSENELVRVIDTPKPCSCILCGNPRKYLNEKTYQEIKFDNFSKTEIESLSEQYTLKS